MENKHISRKAAEITLKKVGKYEDLHAPSLEEGDKIFKEKTRELWKHFAVQGSIGKEGLLPFAGDLDAKGSLYLLRQAGILSPKDFDVYERTLESKQEEEHPRTELKYKENKEISGKKPVKVISFVPAGGVLRGAIHLDTGNKEGIVTEEDATAYFDHHGGESDLSSSATKKLYEGLVSLGMLEKDSNLEKMVKFISQIDNGTFPHAETYFPVFHKTALGLQRFISPEALYKLFQDKRLPTHLLTEKELERYGLKERSKQQKALEEKCKAEFKKLNEEGFVIDTKSGGKALISVGRRWPGDYLAAKFFKCDTYIIWSPEKQSFFVSNNDEGLKFDLPQGVNVRGKMWIKPRTDGKPLEISLKDIIERIAPPDFQPQGELSKYIEAEKDKNYNSDNMNPEKIATPDSKKLKQSEKPAAPSLEKTPTTEMSAALKKESEEAATKSQIKPDVELPLPTDEQVRAVMAEMAEAKEKSKIESAREVYITAKMKLDSERESLKRSSSLTEEELDKYFEPGSGGEKVMAKFNLARDEYFKERGDEMSKALEELEGELKSKGLSEEEYAAEMKKASSAYLVSEFKKLYDTKTEILSVQNQTETPWLVSKLFEVSDEYRKMSLKKKLLISGVLIGGGVVAGSVGGSVGAALAAIVTGGKLSQRFLSSAGFTIAAEAGIKHQQKREMESAENLKFGEAAEKSLEGSPEVKKDDLLKFLKSRDKDIESKGWAAEKDVREVEKALSRRRWLFAGTAGLFMGSGLVGEALSNIGKGLGYVSEHSGLTKFFSNLFSGENATPASVPQSEVVAAVAKEANQTVTIEKGGSISQAAHTLVKEGKLSMEEFRKAWDNSFVDVKGVKVPIKDISLVHSGDQVVYIPEAGGAGHFEVLDYAKDKFGIGTNQDLYAMYEASGKESPVWLQKAVVADVSDALKDNNLDANDVRVLEFHHMHGSLKDQLDIEQKLFEKMSLPESSGKPFSDLFVRLSGSSEHAQALRIFDNHLSQIGFKGADSAEFEAIKNVKVGDLLENRGRSWFKDYFFSSDLVDKNGEKVSKVSIALQRKLAEYIKSLVASQDKKLTVEQFLQKLS